MTKTARPAPITAIATFARRAVHDEPPIYRGFKYCSCVAMRRHQGHGLTVGSVSTHSAPNGPNDGKVGPNSLETIGPLVLFLVVNRLAGLRWAVAAATLWSLKLVVDRRRKGLPLGRFFPILTGAVLARGLIGIITDSEDVYFGLGIGAKGLTGLALVISVLVRKPLIARFLPSLLALESHTTSHPRYYRTANILTAIAGAYYITSALVDLWLYQRSSIEGFVLLRFVANWPLALAALLLAATLGNRQFDQIPDTPRLVELAERRLEQLQTGAESTSHPMKDDS